jgi:flavin-dependent dehydrogenase
LVPDRHDILSDSDVFIAGGGPAGLACAIALARKGLSVHIADGMKPPIDKACGEGLMPDTLAALRDLGIEFGLAGANQEHYATLRGIRFIDTSTDTVAQAAFPSGDGRGMKRKVLHQLLLDRAIELGVRFSWETAVRGTAEDGTTVETNRGHFRARFIVGADGHQSRIRACAGLDRASLTARRIGLRQHFAVRPWSDFVEVYWSGNGQAYVTPVSSGEVCVAFVAHAKFAGGIAEAISHFPQLQAHIAGAMPNDAARGSVTYSRKLHRVTRGNIALLGDASGSVDAVTGEGLSLCFRQALALADAIHANDLTAYQQAHNSIRRRPHLMASAMLLLDRSPFLRSRSIALLERYPQLFARLLEVHIGHAPLRLWSATGLLTGGVGLSTSQPDQAAIPHNAVP